MITPQRLHAFLALVKDVRQAQQLYRRTLDSRLRVEVPRLEDRLDALVETLADDLGTGDPAIPDLFALVEDLARIPLEYTSANGVMVESLGRIDAKNLLSLVTRARDLLDPPPVEMAKGGAA